MGFQKVFFKKKFNKINFTMSNKLFIFNHNLNLKDMKTWKVYEIINSLGTVEWVGETHRELVKRFYDHTKRKPNGNGHGKFYQRQDLSINEVARFDNRKEALELEGKLKLEYGLEWTERISKRILDMQDAIDIRNLYANGNISMTHIASTYNVHKGTIRNIIRNIRYIE